MLLVDPFEMRASAPAAASDPERTRSEQDEAAPTTLRMPPTEQLRPGSILGGKYRLELLLGEGGMGFVWSAYNLELELPVAIKLLRAGQRHASLAERLRLEARAAARLVHPSIVRVFDMAIAENGDPFIVMELLTGESLSDVLGPGRLSGVRAVQLLLPIADGLALAHAKGVVHRDLKPDNVFLSTDGEHLQPKLLDFGIAKLVYGSEVGKLTGKGMLLGSPNYMSPEQARGDDVDYRSDIWSFCVMLYKAVMGKAPFSRPDKRAMMAAIMSDEPAHLAFDASVDDELARLIRWGLSKDREQRPPTMRELGRELAQWLLAHGVSEDACGAPLAPKWLPRPAERCTPLPAPLPAPVASAAAKSPRRRLYPVRRHLVMLSAAASMLILGGSAAWTASARNPALQSAMAEPVAEPPHAALYLTAAPTPPARAASEPASPDVPIVMARPATDAVGPTLDNSASEPAVAQRSATAPVRRVKAKSSPATSRVARLPF